MNNILDAVSALNFANEVRKAETSQMAVPAQTAEQQQYNELVRSSGVVQSVPKIGAALGLLNDYEISQMEKANPSLAPRNPFDPAARNRYSTVGQVLFGMGYPSQPGIPQTTIMGRLGDVFGGDSGIPNPATTMWNARGNVFTITRPAPQPVSRPSRDSDGGSDGWETSGRSGGGMTNFGGRESSVGMEDRSGYA